MRGGIVGLQPKQCRPPSIKSSVDAVAFVPPQAVMPECQPVSDVLDFRFGWFCY